MDKNNKTDEQVLLAMNNFLDKEKAAGKLATESDLLFIKDGSWLKDAAVIDAIDKRQGAWEVSLIFAHYKNPLKLIVRNITRCFNKNKAEAAAFYIRKEAAKDRRGTLNVSINDIHLCIN